MKMKFTTIRICIPIVLAMALLCTQSIHAQEITNYEKRLTELNIQLIKPVPPIANYIRAVQTGKLVYLSGHGPDKPDGSQMIGKVGQDLTIEQGQEAARLTAISLLASLKGLIGDLNKVKRIVKLLGMVNCPPDFTQHPKVINGCSDLLVSVFGDNGKHARSAVGMGSLPGGIPVEIEMIVELK